MNYSLKISTRADFATFTTLTNIFVESSKISDAKNEVRTIVRKAFNGNVIITGVDFDTIKAYFNATQIFLYCKIYEGTTDKLTGRLKLFENAIYNDVEKKCTLEIETIDLYTDFEKFKNDEQNILNYDSITSVYADIIGKYRLFTYISLPSYVTFQWYISSIVLGAANYGDFSTVGADYFLDNCEDFYNKVSEGETVYYKPATGGAASSFEILDKIGGATFTLQISEQPAFTAYQINLFYPVWNQFNGITEQLYTVDNTGAAIPPDDSGDWVDTGTGYSLNNIVFSLWRKLPVVSSPMMFKESNGVQYDYTRLFDANGDLITTYIFIDYAGDYPIPNEIYEIVHWLILPEEVQLDNGTVIEWEIYEILDNSGGADFTNVGAPNNDVGTVFIANHLLNPTSWGTGILSKKFSIYPTRREYANCRDLIEVIKEAVNFVGALETPARIYLFDETGTATHSFKILKDTYTYLRIGVMNDIINYTASNHATKSYFKLGEFFDYLFNFFKIGYVITEVSGDYYFHLKHYSQISIVFDEDYNDFSAITQGYNENKIDIELISQITLHQHDEGGIDFKGAPLFFPKMVNGNKMEINESNFLVDITDIQNNPSKYSDSQNQFVIFHVDSGDIVEDYTSTISGQDVTNGKLSIAYLHTDLFLWDLPEKRVKINYAAESTISDLDRIRKNITVENIHLSGYSLTDINFDYLCKIKPASTEIEAEIISVTESLDRNAIDIIVKY